MTKRINNQLPYPYSQFFKEKPNVKNLNCLEDNTEQCSSNFNFTFIILIVLILFGFNKSQNCSSCDETCSGNDIEANESSNIQTNNDNFYE